MANYVKSRINRGCDDNYKVVVSPGEIIPSANFVRPNVPNGVELIHGPVEINDIIVPPFFSYNGIDATVPSFPEDVYGIQLPTADSGSDPLVGQDSPLLGLRNGSVKGEGGKVWQATLASTYDVTFEDMFFDWLFKHNTDAVEYLFGKWSATAGYWMNTSSANDWVQLTIRGPGGTFAPLGAANSITVGTWYYCAAILDVSGNGQIYMMNVSSGGSPPISAAGNLTTTGKFTIGALSGFTGKISANISVINGYKKISWLNSEQQTDFIADRCATLIGTKALSSRSKSVPVEASRVSTAYLQKDTEGIVKLFSVGKNWTRKERVGDKNGLEKVCSNTEPAATNIAKYNEDLNSQLKIRCTIDTANPAHPTSKESKFFDGIIGASGINTHYCVHDTVQFPTAARHVYFVEAKKGNLNWAALHINSASFGNIVAYFDLLNVVVGSITLQSGTSGIIPIGSDRYIIWVCPDANLFAEATNLYLYPAITNGTVNYDGDDVTVNTWFHGQNLIQGVVPQSYIGPVTTSAVQRAADEYSHDIGASSEIISNFAAHSEDGESWAIKARVTIDQDNLNQPVLIDGEFFENKYFDGLIGTSVSGTHAIQNLTITYTSDIYITSVYVKPGNKSWFQIYMQEAGAGNPNAYFHLTGEGIVGTTVNCVAFIRRVYDDVYLCTIVNTINYTSTPYITLYSANDDTDKIFTGDDSTVNTWFFGAQFKLGDKFIQYVGPTTTLPKHYIYNALPGVLNQRIDNQLLYSTELENAAWTKRGTCIVTDNTLETDDPYGGNKATLVSLSDFNNDLFQNLVGTYLSNTELATGFWIKRKDTDGIFNIITPFLSPGWQINLADLPDEWIRIDRLSKYIFVDSEINANAGGDGGLFLYMTTSITREFYIYNPQQTQNRTYLTPSSDFPITTSSPTSLGESKGAMQFDVLIPDHGSMDPIPVIEVLELSNDGKATDRIRIFIGTDKNIKVDLFATGGTSRRASVIGNCANGIWHRIYFQWQIGQLVIRLDSIEGTPVTTVIDADIPKNLNLYTRGNARIGNEQFFLQPFYPGA